MPTDDPLRSEAAPFPPEGLDMPAYVAATAPLLGLTLAPERQSRVAEAFALMLRAAAPVFAVPLDATEEPAPVFRP